MVASKSMGAHGHPLSLTKHAFFVLFMYRGHADVWEHVDTSFVWQSILSLCCVCTGGIQTSSKYMGASRHLSFSSQTHSHFPRLVPTICTKKLHSFILTQFDDGSHLEFFHVGFRHCHLGFRHLVIFSQIHSKTLSLHSDSDSNYFNLTKTCLCISSL